ncbi:2-keto-4-pentenoate hydratase/2-oxohepta-3-ene-1,7-dioic acid hydratase in catechol pathway [Rhodoligotrophos appendicifer]|uniref:fumarylacetoacetate hydrolase family protein n=1 Tax=Rhodoligotrophos appendicifer TaxID=987056 RepID=UPI001184CF2F|nr:fumarylacetoacetate hydrolase family protein [Rhodoligotrophos appendicifer]
MRFVAFNDGTLDGLAVEGENGSLRGLLASDSRFPGHLDHLVNGGTSVLQAAGQVLRSGSAIDPSGISYRPPFANPGKIVCVGLNYADHSAEAGFKVPDYPSLFTRFASSLIGHQAPILRPRVSDQLDFEGELVAVIGSPGRHIPKASALDHVAGYSVFNDATVRDYQFKSTQWTIGKTFDGTGAFGPSFVTADELPRGCNGLRLETRLNGATVQSAPIDDMLFDVATLISLLSEAFILVPGDIIVTGTPAGVGFARTPKLFMKPGDVCEVEIEGVGLLRSPVADEI